MAIDPGIGFLIVLAGGTITTFVAVAMIHMVREGRALRARTRAHAALVRQQADVLQTPRASDR